MSTLPITYPSHRRGAAKIPFLIMAFVAPLLIGSFISSVPTIAQANCVCHTSAPATLNGYLDQASGSPNPTTTRVSCNSDVAVYMTRPLINVARTTTKWIVPFYNNAYTYIKKTYGGCTVARDSAAPIGPGCEAFGSPKPLFVQLGLGTAPVSDGWYSLRIRFDASGGASRTNYRSWLGSAYNGWDSNDHGIKRRAIHELCRLVELSSHGVHESPAYDLWGNSKFADICSYDFFNKTGMVSDAQASFTEWNADTSTTYPPGTTNARWFRDWYYPLWMESGYSIAFHESFFGYLSLYFPTNSENGGANLTYSRRMNLGEYVHFMSAAVGRSLVSKASSAFNTAWSLSQFTTARTTFSSMNSKYTYP
ncbi:hypothetical protein DFS34DRAFT_590703 [Phlyctochytrium arcticum]|nr:hypothetical protein DFS34DRAFT_590703 [Phlyctochytrium arcticum]